MSEIKRKPRLRVSIRVMMLLVLVVGGVLGWKINRTRTQRLAAEAIKAADGDLFYDYAFSGEMAKAFDWAKIDFTAEPWAPRWLRKRIGDEFFREVTLVEFNRENPTPEVWKSIAKLDHLMRLEVDTHLTKLEGVSGLRSLARLKSVWVRSGQIEDASLDEFIAIPKIEFFKIEVERLTDDEVRTLARARQLVELKINCGFGQTPTDAGLAHLSRLNRLRTLDLQSLSTKFTDRTLRGLAPILPNLEKLKLAPTTITDQGMLILRVCKKLKLLEVSSALISDASLELVGGLNELEELDLSSTEFSDAGLAALRGLTNLKRLYLDGTRITEAGLVHLTHLTNLERLSLHSSHLTDAQLAPIRKLRRLENLRLNDDLDQLTPEGIESLRTDMPSLGIMINKPRQDLQHLRPRGSGANATPSSQ
jgi:hypothetical protein